MYLGSPGQNDQRYAQMQAEARARQVQALARGEVLPEDPPDNRAVRVIKVLAWSLIVPLVVGGIVWLAGGEPVTIVAAVVASFVALVLPFGWRRFRSD